MLGAWQSIVSRVWFTAVSWPFFFLLTLYLSFCFGLVFGLRCERWCVVFLAHFVGQLPTNHLECFSISCILYYLISTQIGKLDEDCLNLLHNVLWETITWITSNSLNKKLWMYYKLYWSWYKLVVLSLNANLKLKTL
jgi:hypothetical protein